MPSGPRVNASISPIDAVAALGGTSGLRVYLDDAGAADLVATVLEDASNAARGSAKGPVMLCLADPALPWEVEVDLGREFAINPQIRSAVNSLQGVMTVEDL